MKNLQSPDLSSHDSNFQQEDEFSNYTFSGASEVMTPNEQVQIDEEQAVDLLPNLYPTEANQNLGLESTKTKPSTAKDFYNLIDNFVTGEEQPVPDMEFQQLPQCDSSTATEPKETVNTSPNLLPDICQMDANTIDAPNTWNNEDSSQKLETQIRNPASPSDQSIIDSLLSESEFNFLTSRRDSESDDAFLNDLLKSIDEIAGRSPRTTHPIQQQGSIMIQTAAPIITTNNTNSKLGQPKSDCCSGSSSCCSSNVTSTVTKPSTGQQCGKQRAKSCDKNTSDAALTNALISCLITQAPQQASSSCCDSSTDNNKCSCQSPHEGLSNGCCIVICLKTLDRIRNIIRSSSAIKMAQCSTNDRAVK